MEVVRQQCRSLWDLVRPLLALSLLLSAGSARAIEVSYFGTDLPDEPEAGDRWLDEFPYDAGWGFSVLFDPTLYAGLEVALPVPRAAWDPIALAPDPSLPVVESGTTIVRESGAIAALFRLRAPRRSRC